ncbi:MAG: hypothetical protein FJ308_20685 [Planctomycetes bacterium]|nr:hypothetical protein [Planctomycetota bacterium]
MIPSDSTPTKAVLPAMVIAQRDISADSPNPAKPVVAVAVAPEVESSKSGSTKAVQNEFAIPSQRPGALAQPSVHAMVDEAASAVAAKEVPSGKAASKSRQPEWIRPKPVRAISASAVVRLDESSVMRHATEPSAVASQDAKSIQGAASVGPAVVAAISPTLQGPVPSVMVDIAPPTRLEERPATAKPPQVAASHSAPNSVGTPQAAPSVAAIPGIPATTASTPTQIANSPAVVAPVVGDLKDQKTALAASQSAIAPSLHEGEFSMPQAIRIGGETISKVTAGPSAVDSRAMESVAATAPSLNNPSITNPSRNDPSSKAVNAEVGSSPSGLKNTDAKNNEVKVAAKDPVLTATPDATSVVLNAPKLPEYPRVSAPIPLLPQTAVVAPTLPPSLSNPLPATVPPLPSSLLASKFAPTTTPAAAPTAYPSVTSQPAGLSPSTAQVAAIPRVSSMPNALPAPSQSTPSLVSTSSNRGMVLTPAVTNRPVVTPTLPANLPNASASQLGSANVATKPADALPLTTANRNAVPVAAPSGNGALVQIESQAASEILIDGNITKIAVGDESICRALASNGRIFVVAGQLGETTIEVHTSNNSAPKLYQVQVVAPWQKANQGLSDIDQLRVAISNAVPDADIEFQSQADGSLVVRGTVGSEDQAKRVLELTRKLMLVPVLDRVDVR